MYFRTRFQNSWKNIERLSNKVIFVLANFLIVFLTRYYKKSFWKKIERKDWRIFVRRFFKIFENVQTLTCKKETATKNLLFCFQIFDNKKFLNNFIDFSNKIESKILKKYYFLQIWEQNNNDCVFINFLYLFCLNLFGQ